MPPGTGHLPTARDRLLLVALDDLGRPGGGRVRVLAGVTAGPALAQKIPALVQAHFELA